MYKSRLHKCTIIGCLILCMLMLGGCGKNVLDSKPQSQSQSPVIKIAPGAYDSADTAIVISKQEKQNKITFLNLNKKKNYTLNYDGITCFMDKYGTQISVSQLQEGEMVDIQFLKDEKLLSSLTVSDKIWTLNDVTKFEIDLSAGRMKIMDEYYTLDETTVVLSDGKQMEFLDIHAQDVLQVKGEDHKIHSIIIQKGHGYLRLENAEYFYGGWIEVGQKVIQKIEEGMLLTVPEGEYEVYISHSGIEGTKQVSIKRNEETKLDVSDLKKEDLIKYGNLIITVDPSSAEVYIDGKRVDISRIIKASYGIHQLMVKAEGYDTIIQYIRVKDSSANIAVSLDEETVHTISGNSVNKDAGVTDNKNSSSENNTVSGNNVSANAGTTGYKVTIEAPVGAEVYVDGNYVGIIPASFAKKPGTHDVTIRKSGYKTRSYTVDVDDENKDINFSFSELTKTEG
ncbi:MAG: PEGA domain-containing protein [Lachnospiraceae bacterium]|nr:PEGA domain-containing protein [Lachnospiraceae bacterium]